MLLEIHKQDGTPIYLQLKRQIERLIRAGIWEKGHRLPTERELAESLGISRNTVSLAYNELKEEGILSSHQGRGTFVAGGEDDYHEGTREERLLRAIDLAMEQGLDLGFNLDEFMAFAADYARRKKEMLRQIKVAFIECNREQLDYFSKELELGSGVTIVPVLMDDFRRDPSNVNARLAGVDLVVTTFFHLQEVRRMIGDPQREVLGIALDPQLETIVRIARLPRDIRVGMVCLSRDFADRVQRSVQSAGINIQIQAATTRNQAELAAFLKDLDACIVSPGRKVEVEALFPPGREIIEFIYKPDAGSINMLESVLMERKRGGSAGDGRRGDRGDGGEQA